MTTSTKTTAVFLTDEQAAQFVQFQRHWNMMGLLESVGAFSIRGGSVTINFDTRGKVSSIDKKEHFHADPSVV